MLTDDDSYAGCPDDEHVLAHDVAPMVVDAGGGYELSKESATGTVFTLRRLDRRYVRTCTHAGAGGCASNGSW